MSQELNIRLAEISELDAIDEIYNQAIAIHATADLTPYSIQQRSDWFNQHKPDQYPVLVYETDKTICGWLSISPYRYGRMALRYTAEISCYIHNDFKNKGIGSRLLAHGLKHASELGLRQVFAIILEYNQASLKLFRKFGFEQWGFLPEVAEFNCKARGQYYLGKSLK